MTTEAQQRAQADIREIIKKRERKITLVDDASFQRLFFELGGAIQSVKTWAAQFAEHNQDRRSAINLAMALGKVSGLVNAIETLMELPNAIYAIRSNQEIDDMLMVAKYLGEKHWEEL